MPELPEVEHVRRTLKPLLVGAVVTNVQLRRCDVVRNRKRVRPCDLLEGATIRDVVRHGKDLAISATDGRTVGVHLGMSGWLSWIPSVGEIKHKTNRKRPHLSPLPEGEGAGVAVVARHNHVHCIWHVKGPRGAGVLRFRDPRRFGGLWVYLSEQAWREERLGHRGPDALTIKPNVLIKAFTDSRRPVKAALLDQSVLAGVGNIYADESLFAARIHPALSAHQLARRPELVRELCSQLRRILRGAIRAGGSTVRSYQGVNGEAGSYVRWHKVYGRAGEPCVRCSHTLQSRQLAQRTTVYCPHCQPHTRSHKRQTRMAASTERRKEVNSSSS